MEQTGWTVIKQFEPSQLHHKETLLPWQQLPGCAAPEEGYPDYTSTACTMMLP